MTPKFITPCYVRVDTPKGRQYLAYKLAKIGYDVCPCVTMDKTCSYEPDAVFVFTIEQSAHIIEDRDFSENTIDCGTNTELFLALAGMRSDTDKGQWFNTIGSEYRKESWILCQSHQIYDDSLSGEYRKATAQEIVEYFNNKTK